MVRFSIAKLMGLVLLAAGNLAVLRLLSTHAGPEERKLLLLGFLPLADTFFLSAWMYLRRYRVTIVRREGDRPLRFVGSTAAMLAAALAGVIAAPNYLLEYVENVAQFLIDLLPSLKKAFDQSDGTIIEAAILGLVLSGPPIVLALVWSFGFGRYRLVVTPRAVHNDAPARSS